MNHEVKAQDLHELGVFNWFDLEHEKDKTEALIVLHSLSGAVPHTVIEELYQLVTRET